MKSAGDFGVVTSDPTFDWPRALERKNKIVTGLVRGLSGLLKHRKVDVISGHGRLAGPGKVSVEGAEGTSEIEGRHMSSWPPVRCRLRFPGFAYDGERIVSSDHALDWPQRPNRVGIIGGGIIGCEFASLLVDVGAKVVVFELLDQILPGFDPAAAKELQKHLERRGVRFILGTGAEADVKDEYVQLNYGEETIDVDTVLVAVGRRPVTGDLGLDTTAVETDRGYVVADLTTMETAESGCVRDRRHRGRHSRAGSRRVRRSDLSHHVHRHGNAGPDRLPGDAERGLYPSGGGHSRADPGGGRVAGD